MLLKRVNGTGQIHCVPASLKGLYVIRFTVTSTYTTEEDITRDWKVIQSTADDIIPADNKVTERQRVVLAGNKKENTIKI
jgi:histidine decarboxylase